MEQYAKRISTRTPIEQKTKWVMYDIRLNWNFKTFIKYVLLDEQLVFKYLTTAQQ